MKMDDLKIFAKEKGIKLEVQERIAAEAREAVTRKYNYSPQEIKQNFDSLLQETEKEAYRIYLVYQQRYVERVFEAFAADLISSSEITHINQLGKVLGKYSPVLDKFFLSLAQSRKSRAGKSFEDIHNALFKALDYKFDEQKVINGKPDFLMPSYEHYRKNPMDCVIFTSKRTLRERWRQIVTEGTRGLGFFLATIDENVSKSQLQEMLHNRIFLVCPDLIRKKYYSGVINVLSFTKFFEDYLDPAMSRWRKNGVI